MIDLLKQKGNSKLQEKIAEYAFLTDLLTDSVRKRVKTLISRSDFDEFGYDVLAQIEGGGIINKIQLKAVSGKAAVWDAHKSLISDETGNVVLVVINEHNQALTFDYYTLISANREEILQRLPKKPHPRKCKLKKGDLEKVEKNEMLEKILNYTPGLH